MRAILLAAAMLALAYSKVVKLDDKSFEHDTQASTGSTTGDWFVAFVDGGSTNT